MGGELTIEVTGIRVDDGRSFNSIIADRILLVGAPAEANVTKGPDPALTDPGACR